MKQLTFRLHPGQLLKESIEQAARDHRIQAGVLFSIVGGLEKAVLRLAGATPTHDPVKEYSGPLEIVSGTGTISRDGCHIHVSLSDTQGNVVGGHLKDGCVVKFTAEIVIGIFEDVSYTREPDTTTGYPELRVEKAYGRD